MGKVSQKMSPKGAPAMACLWYVWNDPALLLKSLSSIVLTKVLWPATSHCESWSQSSEGTWKLALDTPSPHCACGLTTTIRSASFLVGQTNCSDHPTLAKHSTTCSSSNQPKHHASSGCRPNAEQSRARVHIKARLKK